MYGSKLVSQVINKVMTDGKKSTAEQIVYDALEILSRRTKQDPVAGARGLDQGAHPRPGGSLPPRRRRHLPGARRGPVAAEPAPWPSAGSSSSRAPAARRRWPSASPASSATPSPSRAARTSGRTTSSAWRRPTRPSPTTAGSSGAIGGAWRRPRSAACGAGYASLRPPSARLSLPCSQRCDCPPDGCYKTVRMAAAAAATAHRAEPDVAPRPPPPRQPRRPRQDRQHAADHRQAEADARAWPTPRRSRGRSLRCRSRRAGRSAR